MLKKSAYHLLFALNIIALIMAFGQMLLSNMGYTEDQLETFTLIRTVVTAFVLVFVIWNIVIWSKKDKEVKRFLLLFFLPGLYTLFYYYKVVKNDWI